MRWMETVSGLEVEVDQLREELVQKERDQIRLIKKIEELEVAHEVSSMQNSILDKSEIEEVRKTLEEERQRYTAERSNDQQRIKKLEKALKIFYRTMHDQVQKNKNPIIPFDLNQSPNQNPKPSKPKKSAPNSKPKKKPALIQKRPRNAIIEEQKQDFDVIATPMEVAKDDNESSL